jgi:hypothetical protein
MVYLFLEFAIQSRVCIKWAQKGSAVLIRIGSGSSVLGSHPVVLGSWAVLHERAPFFSRPYVPDLLPLPPLVRYYYLMVFPSSGAVL